MCIIGVSLKKEKIILITKRICTGSGPDCDVCPFSQHKRPAGMLYLDCTRAAAILCYEHKESVVANISCSLDSGNRGDCRTKAIRDELNSLWENVKTEKEIIQAVVKTDCIILEKKC